RPEQIYLGVSYVAFGVLLSTITVLETRPQVTHEVRTHHAADTTPIASMREIFRRALLTGGNLSRASQAGLGNNLNDGMAWGLFPLFFAAGGMSLRQIGTLAAIYPAVWGIGQLFTGAWSDRIGRKQLIVWGMWIQAGGIAVTATIQSFAGFAAGGVLLGIGTAMVYPTLLATIGDVAHPSWRASAVGVYRLWRDLGYAVGALLAGLVADAFGIAPAIWLIAGLTFASGALVAVRMAETLPAKRGAV